MGKGLARSVASSASLAKSEVRIVIGVLDSTYIHTKIFKAICFVYGRSSCFFSSRDKYTHCDLL